MSGSEYKHLVVEKVTISSLLNSMPAKEESPRDRARRERDEDIARVIDAVREMPEDEGLQIKLQPNQKLSTMRAAVHRAIDLKQADDVVVAVRQGTHIFVARKAIPGGRGRKPHPRGTSPTD